MLVSIEGNIGSGKTTLLSMIKEKLGDYAGRGRPIVYVDEPVSEWDSIRDEEGTPMLKLFYGDIKKHSFAFQMMAFITRYNAIREARQNNPGAILVMERCLQTDAEVFAKMLVKSGDILPVHYKIYEKWVPIFSKEFHPDLVIYARAEPTKSLERIGKRDRKGEDGIKLEYLEGLHEHHEEWIMKSLEPTQRMLFDANKDFEEDYEGRVNTLIESLLLKF